MTDEQKPEFPVDEPASEMNHIDSPKESPAETKQDKSTKKYLLLGLIPVILVLIGFGLWKTYQPKDIELQGRVEAETVQVATVNLPPLKPHVRLVATIFAASKSTLYQRLQFLN